MAEAATKAAPRLLSAAWSAAAWLFVPHAAAARVQEYQIVRLISYKTSCRLAKLEDRSPPKGPMRFFATCENVSFYPDGIEIVCTDRDDDRTCHAMTRETSFDNLHLLVQPR